MKDIAAAISPGQPFYILLFAAAIIFFAYFYTAITFNPTETADKLKKGGALDFVDQFILFGEVSGTSIRKDIGGTLNIERLDEITLSRVTCFLNNIINEEEATNLTCDNCRRKQNLDLIENYGRCYLIEFRR